MQKNNASRYHLEEKPTIEMMDAHGISHNFTLVDNLFFCFLIDFHNLTRCAVEFQFATKRYAMSSHQ